MKPFFYVLLFVLLTSSMAYSQQRIFATSASNAIFGDAHNVLSSIDFTNCTSRYIDTLPVGVGTIALTPNGKLWAIQSNDFGHLYSVDTATGQVTYVDSFDTHGTYVQSMGVLNDSVLLIQCDSDLYGVTTTDVHSFRIGTVGNYHSGDMTWLGQNLYIIGYSDANPLNSRLVKVTFNNGTFPPIASADIVSNMPSLPYCSALATYIFPNMDTALIGLADSSTYIIDPTDGSYTLFCPILPDSLGHFADAGCTGYPSVPIIIDTVNPVGIINPSHIDSMVKLYPNPTSKTLNISYENNAKATLSLTDISGSLLFKQQLIKGTQQINIASLATGPYIAIVQADDGTIYRHKIIKE